MIWRLTFRQKKALKRLYELHSAHRDWPYGYLPSSIGARNAAAFRAPNMQASGLVAIDRMADNCFRYRLTDSGMALATEYFSKPHEPAIPSQALGS